MTASYMEKSVSGEVREEGMGVCRLTSHSEDYVGPGEGETTCIGGFGWQ